MSSALEAEAVRTCHWLAGTAFPWDITRAVELALLKTFGLPSISGLQQRTGEVEQRPRKRYDDFLYVPSTLLGMLLAEGPNPLRPAAPPQLRRLVQASLRQRSRFFNAWQRRFAAHGSRVYMERLNHPRWSGSQRRIGLTGGIASGKSSVGRLLAEQGIPVLDADRYAREGLAPGSPGARAVLERYGGQVRAHTGSNRDGSAMQSDTIDRAALGRIVFNDPAERQWLEGLVHPLVRERFQQELARLTDAPVLVLMIPLLFETGLDSLCREVWLVDCDEDQQRQRLMERNGLSEAEARARITAQWPLARKRQLADVVLDNRGTPEQLAVRVAAALSSGARQPAPAPPPP